MGPAGAAAAIDVDVARRGADVEGRHLLDGDVAARRRDPAAAQAASQLDVAGRAADDDVGVLGATDLDVGGPLREDRDAPLGIGRDLRLVPDALVEGDVATGLTGDGDVA